MKYLRRQNLNIGNVLDDTVLQRADGNVELNPTQKVIINGDLEFGPNAQIPGPEVTNVIYVTLDGDDDNSGLGEGPGQAKRTLKAALEAADQGTTIFIHSGEYYEDNPLKVPPKVSIIGDNLRRVIIRPLNGPQSANVLSVSKTNEYVTLTTEFPHELNIGDRLRVRVQLGSVVNATDIIPGNKYKVLTIGNSDFTLIGSLANKVNDVFRATAVGVGTGTVQWIEVDDDDINILEVPTPNTLVYRQAGADVSFISAVGKIKWAPDLFLVNSQTYLNGMVFKGLAAPAYCLSIDSDAIVDTSPYIQNCSNINGPWLKNGVEWLPFITEQPDAAGNPVTGPRPLLDDEIDPSQLDIYGVDDEGAGGGMLIDGDRYSSESPIKSMVADAFTQVAQGAIGFHITNFGYMQLVSCFSVFCKKAFYTTRGGYLSISNSVIDFGDEGFVAEGYYPDPYGTGLINQDYYSSVASINVTPGAGYSSVPTVLIEPPTTPGGVTAEAEASIDPILGIVNAITITDPGSGYDFQPAVTIFGGGSPTAIATGIANLQKNLFIDVFELSNKPQIGSLMFLGDDPASYYVIDISDSNFTFRYDEQKCRRDVGIILDAVLADMVFNSNYRSISAGLSYLRSYSSKVTSLQKAQTVAGLTEAKLQTLELTTDTTAISRITSGFDNVINIITFGLSVAPAIFNTVPSTYDPGYAEASAILLANKQFIEDEIIEWIDRNTSILYNEEICRRDIRYIVDAMCYDLLYGGNTQTINAALAYKEGSVIIGEIEETQAAYEYWKSIVGKILKNQLVDTSIEGQVTNLPLGVPLDIEAPSRSAEDLLQIIIDVLDNGPGYIPEVPTQPTYSNGDSILLIERNSILTSTLDIQENVIDYLNNLFGGSSRVYTFPPILSVEEGVEPRFYNVSTISTGGTALEYVGSGVTYNSLPFFGGEPIAAKERVERNGGKCFTVSNDQIGNFRVGEFFNVNALSGEITIDAEKLNLSGLASIGPFRRNGVPVGVQLREVSNNANLISSTGSADVNTVPTQPAVQTYVENRYLNKVASGAQTVESDVAFVRDVEIRGGDITTNQTTFNLLNTTATTVNAFGAATTIGIGAATGTLTINNNKVVINSTGSLQIPVGNISQRGATAFGQIRYNNELSIFEGYGPGGSWGSLGGVRSVDGLTQITAESAPAASDDILRFYAADVDNVTTKIVATLNNQSFIVLNDTQSTDKDTGAVIVEGGVGIEKNLNVGGNFDVNGNVNVDGGDLTVSTDTFNLVNTTATTVNFAGAATTLEIGAATGTTNINNNLDVDGDVNIGGGDLTVSTATFNLANTTATTGNLFGDASIINIGATGSAGTLTIRNDNVVLDGDLQVKGGDLTTNQATFNLVNATATTVNFAGAATTLEIGAATGTTNINNDLDVDGDVNIDGGDLTVGTVSFNLVNTNAETVNFAGVATAVNIGAATGTTSIKHNVEIQGATLSTTQSAFNLLNTTATTVNFAGAGSTINIASNSGNTNVRNNFNVDINSTLGLNTDSLNTINGKLTVNLKDNLADIFTIRESANNYIKINTNDSLELITFGVLPKYEFLNDTDASSTSVASTTFAGGVGIAKKLFVGTDLDVDGNATIGDATTDVHTVTGSVTIVAPDNTAAALQIRENAQAYFTVVTTNGSESVTFESIPRVLINNITDSTDKDTGALVIEGGVGIEKTLNVGGDVSVIGNTTLTGDLTVNGGDITTTASTFNLVNATATTVNFAGAATDLQIGAATGITNVNNNLDVDGDVNIDGGDLTTNQTTFNLVNATATTVNFAGAATDVQIGAATGTTNINNNLDVDGDVNIDGGDLTTNQTTFNLLNTTATTINVGNAATTINVGSSSTIVNIGELKLTTDLEVQYGGTGRSTFTTNGVIYGNTADGLLVTAASLPGSNATTSFGILTTDINNVPVWTDVIDGGSY
jgi:hypothetical protein